jgi:hypothetical protein
LPTDTLEPWSAGYRYLANTEERPPEAAMDRNTYWVIPDGTEWDVKAQGKDTVMATFSHKEDALDYGARRAIEDRPSQLRVMSRDGTVELEETYEGPDPSRPN